MRNSIIGSIISIIILFIGLIVLPIYYMGIITYRDDLNKVQNAGWEFIDKVSDTGIVSEGTLADLNLAIAACSSTYEISVIKEAKVTNPTGVGNETITEWIYSENIDDWNSGDIITLRINQTNRNLFQRISAGVVNVLYNMKDMTFSAMIR